VVKGRSMTCLAEWPEGYPTTKSMAEGIVCECIHCIHHREMVQRFEAFEEKLFEELCAYSERIVAAIVRRR